ncbi:MAG: hypothetical protein VYC34_05885 [Planctomycetota bacterium]|nr:hypothetical protein [Planctomycetota bacterium]
MSESLAKVLKDARRPTFPDGAPINHHIPCVDCAYDLHGLTHPGPCPECATPLRLSDRPDTYLHAPQQHRRTIANAMHRVVQIPTITLSTILFFFLISVVLRNFRVDLFETLGGWWVAVPFVIAAPFFLHALWRLSTPHPVHPETGADERMRQANRFAPIACAILLVIAVTLANTTRGEPENQSTLLWLEGAALIAFNIAWVAAAVAMYGRLAFVALRLGDIRTARNARWWMWANPIAASVIAAMTLLALTPWAQVFDAPSTILTALFGILLFISPVAYLGYATRLRKQFRALNRAAAAETPAAPNTQPG